MFLLRKNVKELNRMEMIEKYIKQILEGNNKRKNSNFFNNSYFCFDKTTIEGSPAILKHIIDFMGDKVIE